MPAPNGRAHRPAEADGRNQTLAASECISHEISFNQALAHRLLREIGRDTYRQIADSTGFHPETVRRYMSGHVSIPAEFVASVCRNYRLSATWALLGIGSPRVDRPDDEDLREIPFRVIADELGRRIEELTAATETRPKARAITTNAHEPAEHERLGARP